MWQKMKEIFNIVCSFLSKITKIVDGLVFIGNSIKNISSKVLEFIKGCILIKDEWEDFNDGLDDNLYHIGDDDE